MLKEWNYKLWRHLQKGKSGGLNSVLGDGGVVQHYKWWWWFRTFIKVRLGFVLGLSCFRLVRRGDGDWATKDEEGVVVGDIRRGGGRRDQRERGRKIGGRRAWSRWLGALGM
uniref:Uncharacterized protein n=1 Tax=Cannabis sativa TaxID=3483 RepID=A0A803QD73_CANSA